MLPTSISSSSLPDISQEFYAPTIQVALSRAVFRPTDLIEASIDIDNFGFLSQEADERRDLYGEEFDSVLRKDPGSFLGHPPGLAEAILIEDLTVELKGVEKLDLSWVRVPKGPTFATYKKGERVFVEAPTKSIAKDLLIEFGESKSFSLVAALPPVLPPSYRGTAVKYHYYLSVTCRWSPVLLTAVRAVQGSAQAARSPKPLEVRVPLKLWTLPQSSGLTEEELGAEDHYGTGGIIPTPPALLDLKCTESQDRGRWVAASDSLRSLPADEEEAEEEESAHLPLGRLRLVEGARLANQSLQVPEGGNLREEVEGGQEGSGDSNGVAKVSSLPLVKKTQADPLRMGQLESLLVQQQKHPGSFHLPPGENGHSQEASGSFQKERERAEEEEQEGQMSPMDGLSSSRSFPLSGRTYNLRMDDNILVRFTPRRFQQTYYLGDTVSGTLSFPHSPEARKCLAVSVILETHEVINPLILHPSRRAPGGKSSNPSQSGTLSSAPPSSVCVTRHSEFHEVSADISATHFLFSLPVDAPPAFATPLLSLQWSLRFEFVASRRPLIGPNGGGALPLEGIAEVGKGTERGGWSLPIVVHAPLRRTYPSGVTGQVAFSSSRGERFTKPLLSNVGDSSRRSSYGLSRPPSSSTLKSEGLKGKSVTRVLDFSQVGASDAEET